MKRKNFFVFLVFTMILAAIIIYLIIYKPADDSEYQKIVNEGYNGSPEVWLAALVGETVSDEGAYDIGVHNGYSGTYEEWSKIITGVESDDRSQSMFELACENGFVGNLSEWLDSLVDTPSELGRSGYGERKTEYELACEYGFSGSYSEWLVSLVEKNGG